MLTLTSKYNENEVVDLVEQLLHYGLKQRASDIHFEPYQNEYRIRMRIDGVLQTIRNLPVLLAKSITVRLKIMAKLNIAEQRLPQDGQFTIMDKTMRLSCIPVLYGEKIVLRVMDNHQFILSIQQLGLSSQELNDYQTALRHPQGLILVTGPTGSGKTITLYSGLKEINHDTHNICSVEDPIEMPIDGMNQTQINTKVGLNFTHTLRSFLRQDPDIIMIGEIRDHETAEIAVQAAQTGHLVLSTLHTNSSAEAMIRLNQMGIKNYAIASSLKLIIAQRLVRKLCQHCKRQSDTPFVIDKQNYIHFVAQSCPQCIGGYHGRTGVYEFLPIKPQIQALLLSEHNISLQILRQAMQTSGVKTLSWSGLDLIKQGVTSLAEIQRVLGGLYD
ncbi:protein transport protein HofB [Orbus hercynius]|uniref:Protein transport protein HofB n=1 Tax=Orbus hercynius TaxID=593135 RepID=A0A495RH76_9GAMM|nr:ATPase, T2SS/T4P/T4SS family [Orbus hercynius]RKS86842.1 protein transport protein HofB [Orbus hercynius]